MKIPFDLLMDKERAESFHRKALLIRDRFGAPAIGEECWSEIWRLIGEADQDRQYRPWHPFHSLPMPALEHALRWANGTPPPPADALQVARAVVEATLAAWFDAWLLLGKMLDVGDKSPCRSHPAEYVTLAMAGHRRAVAALGEGWPVLSIDDERRVVAEMKAGKGLGVDEAFAGVAGVSMEEWHRRAEAHKRKFHPEVRG